MIRKLAVLGSAYLLGLFAASFFALWLSCVMGGLFLCAAAVIIAVKSPAHDTRLFAAAAVAISLAAGIFIYSGYDGLVSRRIISDSGKEISFYADISDVNTYSSGSVFCTARVKFPCGIKGSVGWFADSSDSDIVRGDRVKLSGTLYAPKNTDFFDSKDYYASEGVFLLVGKITEEEYYLRENNLFYYLENFRENVRGRIRKYIPSEEGELMIGMIFGKGSWRILDSTENALYRAGIGHIASVSGLHLGLAAGIASMAAAALRLGKKQRLALIIAVSLAFMAMADFSLSVTRAFIMIIFVYSADLLKRQNDPLTSLSAAAFLMTVGTPYVIRSASFMLSFSGVFGAAVLAPAILDAYKRSYEKTMDMVLYYNALLYSAVTSVCAAAAVIPASAFCFDELSAVSPLVNLVLSPIYSAAVVLTLIGAVLTLLPLNWLSCGLFLSAGMLCRPVLALSRAIGSLSAAAVPTGLASVSAAIFLTASAAAVSLIFLPKKTAVRIISAAMLVSSVIITVSRAIPQNNTRIDLLSDGSGCVLVISENEAVSIFDFIGGKKGAKAARSAVIREDMGKTGLVCLSEKCASTYPFYGELFPQAKIAAPVRDIGLTYSPENNIIVFGGVVCRPCDGYSVIETQGVRIICVNKKCDLPEEHFDMCVINCRAEITADADIYVVADRNYTGSLSAGRSVLYCQGGRYEAKDGILRERTERNWLR